MKLRLSWKLVLQVPFVLAGALRRLLLLEQIWKLWRKHFCLAETRNRYRELGFRKGGLMAVSTSFLIILRPRMAFGACFRCNFRCSCMVRSVPCRQKTPKMCRAGQFPFCNLLKWNLAERQWIDRRQTILTHVCLAKAMRPSSLKSRSLRTGKTTGFCWSKKITRDHCWHCMPLFVFSRTSQIYRGITVSIFWHQKFCVLYSKNISSSQALWGLTYSQDFFWISN